MNKVDSALQSLEQRWQVTLPESVHRLYRHFEQPYVSPCEFLTLPELQEDSERWFGMLPQYIPFGRDGDGNTFGFYVPPNVAQEDFTVLLWNHEYDHYLPIASGFGPFVGWCVIQGRYQAQDEFDEDDPEFREEEENRRRFAEFLDLPKSLVLEPLPRNDRELYERLAAWDPQSTQALSQLGSGWAARKDAGRARDFFTRASESAPWFADPYYLLAETYREESKTAEAISRWWQVVRCPIALSTRTSGYDLGQAHPDVEVYEAAVNYLVQNVETVPSEIRANPVGRLVLEGDPFEPDERLALAAELAESGDPQGEEREALNALSLSTDEALTSDAYDRLINLYDRTGRRRESAFCAHDRTL